MGDQDTSGVGKKGDLATEEKKYSCPVCFWKIILHLSDTNRFYLLEYCGMVERIKSDDELRVFKEAFDLAMVIFHLTKTFPAEERYNLTSQLLRSSRSVCLNLGEAWRRRRYKKAFIARLNDCEAEACESQVSLRFAHACGYISEEKYKSLEDRYEKVIGMLIRMIANPDKWTI